MSFHPSRTWVLVSLHDGHIQLWDYRMGSLLETFTDHEGPVRGVDFHITQPLFVSGGDDCKIKVWNYKLKRCLFTLSGHLDYIRTVQFHVEHPWIVSASDDQTIRVWNWQARQCISVLTGHNHYVMCAAFHKTDDLIVSASLDQTVRVWDTTGLRKKTARGPESYQPRKPDTNAISRVNADLFGGTDAVVKYVLEGHDRGVNWAMFHPTMPLVVSGADDRQVKLWRMNETKAWEVDCLRGHTNNVSSVIFHPRAELILSNSEDRSIRVWDINKRLCLQTFRREVDRFWIMSSHPTQNILGAGHDSGCMVFKLERERPAFDVATDQQSFYYVKDKFLYQHVYQTEEEVALKGVGSRKASLGYKARSLSFNHLNKSGEVNLLVALDTAEGEEFEIVSTKGDSFGGAGKCPTWTERNRFAVLDSSGQIAIKNLKNETTKRFAPPHPSTDMLFFGGTVGRVLMRSEDKVTLFDCQARRVIAELVVPKIKYAVWSPTFEHVVLLSKKGLVICNRQLHQLCSISDSVRVKTAAWGAKGILIYATLNHLKYALPNGDSGLLRTLERPIYITKVEDNVLSCIDREGVCRSLEIDMTECKFKLALTRRRFKEVMRMIRSNSSLCGEAIIGYLQRKGYPEVALHFVENKQTRFNLAIECGNTEIAKECAIDLQDKECWNRLDAEGLRQGNHDLVASCLQQTRDFDRLSFHYLITGNLPNLRRMLVIAGKQDDASSRVHNALYLGDVRERMAVLESVGQYALAFVCAKTHGLEEDAVRLREVLEEAEASVPSLPEGGGSLLMPAMPVRRPHEGGNNNWPLLEVAAGVVADVLAGRVVEDTELVEEDEKAGAFDQDVQLGVFKEDMDGLTMDLDMGLDEEDLMGDGWDEDEDDLDLTELQVGEDDEDDKEDELDIRNSSFQGEFQAPSAGETKVNLWVQNSSLAADHVAAGSFESAMRLLNRQIGCVNFGPLKPSFLAIHQGARLSLVGLPNVPSTELFLERNQGQDGINADTLPKLCITLEGLVAQLHQAYSLFGSGKFPEALAEFRAILVQIPLLVVDKTQVSSVKELVETTRDYALGIILRTAASEAKKAVDPLRESALSAYHTHCFLQPAHLLRILLTSMTKAFNLKNYIHAAVFARRMLELPEISQERNLKLKGKAAAVLKKSEREGRNNEAGVEYDPDRPFLIDVVTLKPIYSNQQVCKCPFCGASSMSVKQVCPICEISSLGQETLGLVSARSAV